MLPDGPSGGPIAQTVALHRDPLAFLRAAQLRYGDVFTLRLATARPIVVAADQTFKDVIAYAKDFTAGAYFVKFKPSDCEGVEPVRSLPPF